MIYDYQDQEGYVSLWVGNCEDYDTLNEYLSTQYLEEHGIGEEPGEIWKELFLPANQDRACEEELKEEFNYEDFNQFEYDFGLAFDEDFREAAVCDEATDDLEKLFEEFSYCDSFIEEAKGLGKNQIPKCNAAVALYNFKFTGDIVKAEHENVSLYFVGYVKYKE